MSRGQRAGIAQLVEQATENRRVPSSNLGPGTFLKRPKSTEWFLEWNRWVLLSARLS